MMWQISDCKTPMHRTANRTSRGRDEAGYFPLFPFLRFWGFREGLPCCDWVIEGESDCVCVGPGVVSFFLCHITRKTMPKPRVTMDR